MSFYKYTTANTGVDDVESWTEEELAAKQRELAQERDRERVRNIHRNFTTSIKKARSIFQARYPDTSIGVLDLAQEQRQYGQTPKAPRPPPVTLSRDSMISPPSSPDDSGYDYLDLRQMNEKLEAGRPEGYYGPRLVADITGCHFFQEFVPAYSREDGRYWKQEADTKPVSDSKIN